jgi:hypothetical protein
MGTHPLLVLLDADHTQGSYSDCHGDGIGVHRWIHIFAWNILNLFRSKPLPYDRLLLYPCFATLTGLLVYVMTYPLPSDAIKNRPQLLVTLCVLSGIFIKQFYVWAAQQYKTLLKNLDKKQT